MPDTVPLIDPDGVARDVPASIAAGALSRGWRPQTPSDVQDASSAAAREADFGGVHGILGAIGAGAARGASLGLSDLAARAIGGKEATDTLQGIRAENPLTSTGSEFAGMLAPSLLTGGAATPAGVASTIGRKVAAGAAGEGAGLLARVAGHATGAAAEGALYGGGQYLTDTALENKPLSAEGFIGGMGKGALFAAPVGGAFALAGEGLQRARALFPRSEITAESAASVKNDASAALHESLADGDAMAASARQKIALADAQAGQAGARTQVTRTVFGGGDPTAMGAQVDATANKAQLTDALQKLETSQAALKDWIAAGGEDEFADQVAGLQPPTALPPEAQSVPIGEFGEPGQRGIKSPEELQRAVEQAGASDASPSVAPTEPSPATAVLRKGSAPRLLDAIGATPAEVSPASPVPASLDDIQPAPTSRAPAESTRVGRRAASESPAKPLAGGAAGQSPVQVTVGGNDASIDRMSLRQLGEYQETLNKAFDAAEPGTPEYAALSEKWDAAVARRSAIRDGRIPDPVASAAPGVASSSMPERGSPAHAEPIATGERISDLKHPDETPENFVLRRMREQGVNPFPGAGTEKRFLGSLGIDWSVPENRELILKMRREGAAVFSRADLIGAMDPALVKSSEISHMGSEMHFIHDDGQAIKALPAAAEKAAATDSLTGLLRGTQEKLAAGDSLSAIGAPARAEYGAAKEARTAAAADHFRGKAIAENHAGSGMAAAERAAKDEAVAQRAGIGGRGQRYTAAPKTAADAQLSDLIAGDHPSLPASHEELGKMFGIDLAEPVGAKEPVGNAADLKALLSQWSDENTGTAVDRSMRARMGPIADDAAIERLLQKRTGKNVDMAPALQRAAQVIGDHEAASAEVAGLLGSDAPKTAVARAQALQAARAAQADAQGASAAKAAQGIQDRAMPALADKTAVTDDIARALQKHESAVEGAKDRALVSMQRAESKAAAAAPAPTAQVARGVGGKLADVGTALEVMKAMGVHVPVLSAIPVIGPVLGLFFKARAVLSVLGRKGGSIGRSTEGLIAATSAATRDRLAAATQAILSGAGKGALRLSEVSAGPAVTLGYKLFPGPGITKSKDPQKLYEARMDEIARAQQPGAIDHAISDRYQTADPNLHDAIVTQTQRGITFLDSKAPKPSILQAVIPGDGVWRPGKAQLDEWGKYVHAVGDPASVLEDLAKGHVTLEGAETLRVVYPELFAEGQRLLMQAAPQMRKTLPYPTRVAISILYRIPVDGSMAPGHLQYLQAGAAGGDAGPAAGAGGPPGAGAPPPPSSLTGPIKLGQSTMTSLDRRAGS